nr:MAG TPA: Major capsid protein [Microviridae sp.]
MKKRSKFSLSNYKILSMKMGFTVPVNLLEVLPGDTVQLSTGIFMRLAPMIAPVMHPVHMTVQHFYVPARILWDDFEDFITGGQDGMNASVPPTVTITPTQSSLADYLGLPLGKALTVSALPFRAYASIWNNYFRDQDLQAELAISYDSGPDSTTSTTLQRAAWQKDYFTTARPWPQKGPAVTIPVDMGSAGMPTLTFTGRVNADGQVVGTPHAQPFNTPGGSPGAGHLKFGGLRTGPEGYLYLQSMDGSATADGTQITNLAGIHLQDPTVTGTIDYKPGQAGIGSIDVSALREAMSYQRFEEHRSLFGSRYEDYLRYLGVRPQDARLQMPEYLGGTSQTIQFSEVLQTGGDQVGQLYGHGISAMRSRRVRRFIPEHGYLMSLLYVRPIPVYAQGVDRLWTRETKLDYWQREMEHIGQQEVYNREVYADGTAADAEIFGFQNRYDEYRRGVNSIAGEFRTTQDYWHMARIFANRPTLNGDFVSSNPTDRIFQASESLSDQLYVMAQNNVVARRLVSRNGNPI